MNIKSRHYLGACICVAIVLAIGVTQIVASQRVNRAVVRNHFAADIVIGVSELRSVTFEYMLHHHERPRVQWQQRHATVARLLANDIYEGSDYQQLVIELRQHHRDLQETFSRLTENSTAAGIGAAKAAQSVELEARLVSQLVAISQEIISTTFHLLRTSEADLENTQRWSNRLNMLAIGAMGLIILAGTVLNIRYVLNPIDRLRSGTEIIGEGDLSYRTGISGGDEIGTLSQAFDRMTVRLQQTHAALEAKTAQLIEANKELESFSYSVSHDLRAPLRAIDGFGQRLLDSCRDKLDASAVHYLERIRAGTQVMAQLIEDLLNLSRVSRTKLNLQPVNLGAQAQRIAAEMQRGEPQRSVELSIVNDDAIVRGDERLLGIVMQNLIGNAWKFTANRDNARIEFGLTPQNGETVYFVRDNGAGFDMAYADKLFAPFQRLHSAAEFAGTGIGLVTVRRILLRHGGRVWAEAATDLGAVFYFTVGKGAADDINTDIAG